jgi:uncharacterized membrane protein YbhN (UPF0104 family)
MLKIIISFILISFLISKLNFDTTIFFVVNSWETIVFSFIFYCIGNILIESCRLFIFLPKNKIKFFEINKVTTTSFGLGTFLPSSFGKDLIKIFFLKKFFKLKVLIKAVLTVRFFGFILVFIYCLLFLILKNELIQELFSFANIDLNQKFITLIIFSSVILAILIFFKKNFLKILLTFLREYSSYLANIKKKNIINFFIFTFLFWVISVMSYTLLINCINLNIFYFDVLFIICFATIISALPISLGGIGIKEGVFSFFLIFYGASTSDAIAISIVLRLFEVIISIFGISIIMISNKNLIKNIYIESDKIKKFIKTK